MSSELLELIAWVLICGVPGYFVGQWNTERRQRRFAKKGAAESVTKYRQKKS